MGTVLSISLGNNALQIGEVSHSRKGVIVSRLIEKEMPEGCMDDGAILNTEVVAKTIVSALKESNIKTKQVIFTIPSGKIMSREIVLPRMKEEKILETIKSNAEEYFPIGLDEYVLSYFKISTVYEEEKGEEEGEHPEEENGKKKNRKSKDKKDKKGKKTKVSMRLMALAASNDMIQSYYDVASLAHLKLVSIDYMGNSVLQVIAGQIGEETCLVIQMSEDNTSLTVFDNNVMILQRNVNYGTSTVIHAVSDLYGLSYQRAQEKMEESKLLRDRMDRDPITDSMYYLLSNMERVIEYYRGRNADLPIENIYFMGEGSRIQGMAELLENSLGFPVHTLQTLKKVVLKPSAGVDASEAMTYIANIGAIIEPAGFVPKVLEQDIRRKLETKACRILVLLSIFTGLIVVTIPALEFFDLSFQKIDLDNKLMALQDVDTIFNNYQDAVQKYDDVEQVGAQVRTNNESLLGFIDVFEQLRPSNISLTAFSCQEGKVTFSALADGKSTVIKLITQLKTIANVSDVDISGLASTFDENGVETVSFSVTCQLLNEDARFTEPAAEEAAEASSDSETNEGEEDEIIIDESGVAGS